MTSTTTTTISERFVLRDRKSGQYMRPDLGTIFWYDEAEMAKSYKSKAAAEKKATDFMLTKNYSLRELEVVHSRVRTVTTTEVTVEIAPTVVAFFDSSMVPE